MKSLIVLLSFAFLPAVLYAQPEVPGAKPDPIVGRWRCSHKLMVEIRADGTAEHTGNVTGTWKSVPTVTVERQYEIRWKGGLTVDAVTLEKSLKKYRAKNNTGFKYTAERVEE
jgi:hypothetical protein